MISYFSESNVATDSGSLKYQREKNEIREKINSRTDWHTKKDVLVERGSTGGPTPKTDVRSYTNRIPDINSIVKDQIHSRSNMTYKNDLETPVRREAESVYDSNTALNNAKWNLHSNDKPAIDSTSQFPFACANNHDLTSSDPANCYHHPISTNISHTLIPSHDANTSLLHSTLRTVENRTMDDRLITSSDLATVEPKSDNLRQWWYV